MASSFDSQSDAPQNGALPILEVTLPCSDEPVVVGSEALFSIKIVSSDAISDPVHRSQPFQGSHFSAEVRRRSPYDFMMAAQDPFHHLRCELPLKFEEIGSQDSIICEYPQVSDHELMDFIEDDESLLSIALIQFHRSILHNLLIFCIDHKVTNLLIQVGDQQSEGMTLFEDFIMYIDKIPTKRGKVVQLTIPVNQHVLDRYDTLMTTMTQQFRQTLWQNQSSNPVVRDYLKANIRFSVVG